MMIINNQYDTHDAHLVKVHPSGVLEFKCSIDSCGRVMIVDPKNVSRNVVLNEGNTPANHICKRGGGMLNDLWAMVDEAMKDITF